MGGNGHNLFTVTQSFSLPFRSSIIKEKFTPSLGSTAEIRIQFLGDQTMAARASSESPAPPLSSSPPCFSFLASSHWEEDKDAAARENIWFSWLPVLSWTRNRTWRTCQSDIVQQLEHPSKQKCISTYIKLRGSPAPSATPGTAWTKPGLLASKSGTKWEPLGGIQSWNGGAILRE